MLNHTSAQRFFTSILLLIYFFWYLFYLISNNMEVNESRKRKRRHSTLFKPHITNTARVNPIRNVKQSQSDRSEMLSKDMQLPSFTIYTWNSGKH